MTSRIWSILVLLYYLYLIVTIIYLLLDNRETAATFAWIFVLIVFPLTGVIVYLLIGRNRRLSHKARRYQEHSYHNLNSYLRDLIEKQDENLKQLSVTEGFPSRKKLFELLYRNSNSLLTMHNSLEFFYQGKDKFDSLLADIKKAEKFIHMEYYIWRSDALTNEIKDILIRKAKEGVEVRILYDVIGSLRLKRKYIKELRKNGVSIYPYDNLRSFITLHSLNYRNHRKIAIIDGTIAYTGGMNIGKEYIDGGKRFDMWRDTHVRIEGEAVRLFQAIFAASWHNTTEEELSDIKYFPENKYNHYKTPLQVTTSGPDSEWSSIEQLYFNLIASSRECICVQSPYFIPTESIYKSLLTATLSGIEVKIMMTGHPDRLMPFWSAYSFFEPLLKAGVKIYHYQKGFMHAKTIIVDEEISSVGTANMDVRSFQLNYEVNMLIYDKGIAQQLVAQFNRDLKDCKELTMDAYYKIGTGENFRNSIARLFAPLM